MKAEIIIQGRSLHNTDILNIKNLIRFNPQWNRTRLSRELCILWGWRNAKGLLKDMACRTMLLKLERRGMIKLPPARNGNGNGRLFQNLSVPPINQDPINDSLNQLGTISLQIVNTRKEANLFNFLLKEYHYLSYKTPVGENIRYIAYDIKNRALACFLFGAAAWKMEARDQYIGWKSEVRERNLPLVVNQMRFLICPWVSIKNLASHLQSKVIKRINKDWINKYGHEVYLLESFVEEQRFQGTCYKASNWRLVGKTKGRTRNDRHNCMQAPIKTVYLYPLTKKFRSYLHHIQPVFE